MTNKTPSFHINGFWFHLSFKCNNTFQDQHGMEWFQQGNKIVSAAGGFVYNMPSIKEQTCYDSLSNKDFFIAQREAYYYNRIKNNLK